MFKIRDRVFDILYGWGEVIRLYSSDWEKLASDYLACGKAYRL